MLILDKTARKISRSFFPLNKAKVVEWFLLGIVADVQLLTKRGILQQNPKAERGRKSE